MPFIESRLDPKTVESVWKKAEGDYTTYRGFSIDKGDGYYEIAGMGQSFDSLEDAKKVIDEYRDSFKNALGERQYPVSIDTRTADDLPVEPCKHCGRTFDNRRELGEHMLDDHLGAQSAALQPGDTGYESYRPPTREEMVRMIRAEEDRKKERDRRQQDLGRPDGGPDRRDGTDRRQARVISPEDTDDWSDTDWNNYGAGYDDGLARKDLSAEPDHGAIYLDGYQDGLDSRLGAVDTSKTHEYLVSGCRNQFMPDHDHADCWRNFMKFNGLPEDTTYGEFYGE